MTQRITGRYERVIAGGEAVSAFVPAPLPPGAPPISIEGRLGDRLRLAEQALARLDLAGDLVPSVDWFIYAFVRKEAVLSSQIEGTQATLVDLMAFEADNKASATPDLEEVCNYLDALGYVRAQLSDPRGLPLSARLLCEAHRRLMNGVRGAGKQPGEVRRSQNWIGGSRPGNAAFVPAPPQIVPELLGALETWIHSADNLPALARAGLAHVQFETIHPFLDGNGRIGRLLITMLLEHWGLLIRPMLYLSLFFKRHQGEYYRRLDAVRTAGDWEGWLDFFLDGVATIADEAVATARDLFALAGADRERLLASGGVSVTALRLFEALPRHPIVTVASAMTLVDASKPTATRAINVLVANRVLVEVSGRRRDRSFVYQAYLNRLSLDAGPG